MVPVAVAPADTAPVTTPPVTTSPGRRPLVRLCEAWPVVDGDDRPGERTVAVAVDGDRPVALWLVAGHFDRLVPVTMRANAAEDPRPVLARAMTRPAACRFDPVVCVDDADRLVGVLPVEVLARHVATT